jgi:predicted RNA-binding Zn-ribbon protein involved in translation (DUF1610 family)
VAHHADIRKGDRVALWDKSALIGISIVDDIIPGVGEKLIRRCPFCRKASIKARLTIKPTYRCHSCGMSFDDPQEQVRTVKTYRAVYESSWIELSGSLSGPELRNLCFSTKSQQSLRPLNWTAFSQAIQNCVSARLARRISSSAPTSLSAEGHKVALTRVRRGQSQFRSQLLESFGETCAITGPCPAVTLEAAHLYSYADYGKHFEHGGILLRRDVHRLFDRGDLAIHPELLRIDLDPYVSSFDNYRGMHGKPIRVAVESRHVSWLHQHWSQHRDSELGYLSR